MISFMSFLAESNKHPSSGRFQKPDKHIVLAFGKFNPPTKAHVKIAQKVKQVADKVGGDHAIIMSHIHNKRNPLSPLRKLQYAKTLFPKGTNVNISTTNLPDLPAQAKQYNQKGYNHLHVVTGSHSAESTKRLLEKGNNKRYNFRSITVHSVNKQPSVSVRKLIGDQDKFNKTLPKGYHPKLSERLLSDIKRGLG